MGNTGCSQCDFHVKTYTLGTVISKRRDILDNQIPRQRIGAQWSKCSPVKAFRKCFLLALWGHYPENFRENCRDFCPPTSVSWVCSFVCLFGRRQAQLDTSIYTIPFQPLCDFCTGFCGNSISSISCSRKRDGGCHIGSNACGAANGFRGFGFRHIFFQPK